ncbi:MAG: 7-carboxy-7-deazaguanine synthase QueE [Candidatus Aminicenantes bacterium]|jgi:organic radical activating enzyme
MQGPSILKINEIFWSFQGEGSRVGVPSIFLRFAGCSAQCPYCDSKDSWKIDGGASLSIKEILSEIEKYKKKYPQSQVVITGGEPLEQELSEITTALKKKKHFLSIETNGIHFQDLPVDWWTVSPKDVTDYVIHRDLLKKTNEIKLVVNNNLTMEVIKRVRSMGSASVPIFFQPEANDNDRYVKTFSLFQQCQEANLENTRCGIQLHKIYNVK